MKKKLLGKRTEKNWYKIFTSEMMHTLMSVRLISHFCKFCLPGCTINQCS